MPCSSGPDYTDYTPQNIKQERDDLTAYLCNVCQHVVFMANISSMETRSVKEIINEKFPKFNRQIRKPGVPVEQLSWSGDDGSRYVHTLGEWYEAHLVVDEARRREKAEKQRKASIKKNALAKLTDEEKAELGV